VFPAPIGTDRPRWTESVSYASRESEDEGLLGIKLKEKFSCGASRVDVEAQFHT
jgi:hypothetical protein